MIRSFFFAAAMVFFACLVSQSGAMAQDEAQPMLEASPLTVVSGDTRHDFTVEVAETPEQIATGMMFRAEMASDAGMLFDLGASREVNFFMKNTLIPLDLLFMDEDGQVLAIAENAVPGSLRLINPGVEVRAVLEINGGQSSELGISPGDRVEHAVFATGDGG
ncbi:MAG: DUF192 domain-containing protein [Pseudomonadota bacterium]